MDKIIISNSSSYNLAKNAIKHYILGKSNMSEFQLHKNTEKSKSISS